MTPAGPQGFVPDAQNGRLLRDAFGRFATGVTLVTAAGPQGCTAITANSFSSISMEPPLIMWAPARASARFATFAAAAHFAVHVLARDQADLAWAVARNRDALDHHPLQRNDQGVPVLDRCLARFDCATHALHEAGDHMIVLGRVLRAQLSDGDPLAFFGGQIAGITRG